MKLPIKTKKDWCIILIIGFVAFYYISKYYDTKIEEWMFPFSPNQLNAMNYPGGWGNLILVGLVMTVLVVLILLFQKKNWKYIVLAAVLGIVFSAGMFAGFVIHTNLIVGTGKAFSPTDIRIYSDASNSNVDLVKDSSLGKELTEAVVSLKALPKSDQKTSRTQNVGNDNIADTIWISFPEKYGQSYDLILYIEGDRIYSYHGLGTPDCRVFYRDNGLLNLLKKIKDENKS